jgi:hypothetical protein
MTELELHREPTTFAHQIEQAKALAAGSMLPGEYRGQPANVLIAMNLGQAMGLSPAESLYRIAVIKGKPTASAELIASNVRKAGHRLRVTMDEETMTATATIVRADDPDFEFTIRRDMAWAQSMGLASNENYRKQPMTMLANRAITACARLACPETLYGVAYSPDEMTEGDYRPTRTGLASVLADPSPAPDVAASVEPPAPPPSPGPADEGSTTSVGEDSPYLNPRGGLARRMFAALGAAGITDRDERLAEVSAIIGRTIASSSEMTDAEAEAVIATLEIRPHDDALPIEGELVEEPGA